MPLGFLTCTATSTNGAKTCSSKGIRTELSGAGAGNGATTARAAHRGPALVASRPNATTTWDSEWPEMRGTRSEKETTAMINPVRQDVLQALAELSELAPEVRFGQLIANLCYLARGLSNESIWD